MLPIKIIVAFDQSLGIGKGGRLPWQLAKDLKYFRQITTQTKDTKKINAVIMGRVTWESIPDKFRPLAGRLNVVITSQSGIILPTGVLKANSVVNAAKKFEKGRWLKSCESIYIIGGGQVYQEIIKLNLCDEIYATTILKRFDCDTFFPPFNDKFIVTNTSEEFSESGIAFKFVHYVKK